MKYLGFILFFGILVLGPIVGILFQDELIATLFLVYEALAILVPLVLIIGAIAVFQIVINRRLGKSNRYLLLIAGSSFLSAELLIATDSLIDKWKVEAVASYVSHAAPILDQIKTKTGAYPSELPINLLGPPPSLLRDYGDYTATPESFRFEYVDEPAGWAGGEGALKFESSRRKWVEDQ